MKTANLNKPFSSRFGPGLLVTAAFVGPGTVFAASLAGKQFGFSLLWAVGFAVLAAVVLQEMASRLGIITGSGLSESISKGIKNPFARRFALGLVLLAILFGNAAYQTGNLIGAAAGLNVLTGVGQYVWVALLSLLTLVVIWVGRFDLLQFLLTLLVIAMSLLFVAAALLCGPDLLEMAEGFVPSIPEGAEWAIIGLIGTTVVPYNLFLHASASAKKWSSEKQTGDVEIRGRVRESFVDTLLAVVIGGVITCAILVTAAAAFAGSDQEFGSVREVALQLRPAVGGGAELLFSIGLFAAGLTSSITAPVAAGYASAGCFGWTGGLKDSRLKLIATLVVICGAVCAIAFGKSPIQAIIAAQVANGILLPIIAIFLLITVNQAAIMKGFQNRWLSNLFGVLIILITIAISARSLNRVFQTIHSMISGGAG